MRQNWADTITGICILYMIAMHVSISSEIETQIYVGRLFYFFMPWFFFKSGWFFKERKTSELIVKDFKRLLVPYFFWGAVGWTVNRCLYHDDTWFHYLASTAYKFITTGGGKR